MWGPILGGFTILGVFLTFSVDQWKEHQKIHRGTDKGGVKGLKGIDRKGVKGVKGNSSKAF